MPSATVSKATDEDGKIKIEAQIRQAAAVEPALKFPARIGLARIDHSRIPYGGPNSTGLSVLPKEEIEAWEKVKEKLGSGFGEFIPLSPMIANMTSDSVTSDDSSHNIMSKIRLGAARQHLDAVLVYEVYSKSSSKDNILSVANITIIGGYLLPSKAHEAEGFANAMLIDVIQGYPYGTANVTVDKEEALSSSWGWGSSPSNIDELSDSVKTKAALKLSEEVEHMFERLHKELGDKKTKNKK